MSDKPRVKLIGEDDNIFNLVSIASKALERNHQHDNVSKMQREVLNSNSYDEALQVLMKYCEVE